MARGRIVRLYVGDFEQGNSVEGVATQDLSALDMEFDVTRSVKWYENEAKITLYNPSPDTLSMLMTSGNSIVLQAGYYDQGVGNIFVGQIASVIPRRHNKDIVVEIAALSARGAFYQLARLNMAVAFRKGDSVKSCLEKFCDYAGIALRAGFDDLSMKLDAPYNKSGTFTAVIEDFTKTVLFPGFKKSIYLDNNEMIVLGEGNSMELEQVTLDYDSGLLEAFKVRDESQNKVNFGDDPEYYMLSGGEQEAPEPKQRPSRRIDRFHTVTFRSLMNAALVPNGFVKIDSRVGDKYDPVMALNGRYVVTECRYHGGNVGSDFTVTCKAREAY